MQHIIPFLKKLRKNNNKTWFDAHKDEYEVARNEFVGFVADVIKRLEQKDKAIAGLDPAKCVFRIYRDIRFSKDKTPYKTHLGADFGPGGRKANRPGYYMQIEPGNSFLVAGMWKPEPEELQKLRMEIDYNFKEFSSILKASLFKKSFGELSEEDKGKLPPKGYNKENPAIEFLKMKSFVAVHEFTDDLVVKKDFPAYCAKILSTAIPFNEFLRRALD